MKTIRTILRILLSLLLTMVFMYLAFRGKDISLLMQSLMQVHWIWFVGLFVGAIISHLFRAWRWKLLLFPVKKEIRIRNTFSALMVGYMINGIVPRLGEIVRSYAIKKLENISGSTALGTVILERVLDVITFLLIVFTVLSIYNDEFALWFPSLAQFEWMIVLGAFLMFCIFILIFIKAEIVFSIVRVIVRFMPMSLQKRSEEVSKAFLEGFQAAKNPANFFMIAFTSILTWVSYIVLIYIPFFAFQLDNLSFGAATIVQVASGIAFAIPTPNGIGSYHAFTMFTLSELFHVDSTVALSYAAYTHAVGFLSTLCTGLWYMVIDKIHLNDAR